MFGRWQVVKEHYGRTGSLACAQELRFEKPANNGGLTVGPLPSPLWQYGRAIVIYMRDADVRLVLKHALVARYGETDTIIVEELGLCRGSVRADIAVINGLMKGFEIKSDRDTLQRSLPKRRSIAVCPTQPR